MKRNYSSESRINERRESRGIEERGRKIDEGM